MEHLQRGQHHASYAGGGGGREDCWTEEATEALIEVGNLRQKDWKDVAMAVNEHLVAVGKPRKTDIQCKNRIDTLKKKFKLEKSKPGSSRWAFYPRLEELICPDTSSPAGDGGGKKPQGSVGTSTRSQRDSPLSFTIKRRSPSNANPNAGAFSEGSSSRSKMNSSPVSSESSRGDDGRVNNDGDGDEEEGNGSFHGRKVLLGRRRQWGSSLDIDRLVGGGGGSRASGGSGGVGMDGAFGELAKAIVKFGEIYERVENSKQQQMLELERQRMEFAKELEFQRMQMFMEAQLELEKMKRPKYSSGAGEDTDVTSASLFGIPIFICFPHNISPLLVIIDC
ncbi:unnamed protein product [Spirodela intermedia]|uniref:Myb-like domain-containing protein n=1 Tax=Spirodela intermedia TaxID=51605 RepID=A0A7I8IVJ4_SPIIN|nr:unnamed protein product [Spirodela intermedia]CAA6661839.1 unnamed protein product [Spirodela intermedia]